MEGGGGGEENCKWDLSQNVIKERLKNNIANVKSAREAPLLDER